MIDKANIMIDNANNLIRLDTKLISWNWAIKQTVDKWKI